MSVATDQHIEAEHFGEPPVTKRPTAYIDIETATAPRVLQAAMMAVSFTHHVASEAGAAERAAWLAEHAGDEALSPIRGRVICWAVATSDGRERVQVDRTPGGDERSLLAELLDVLTRWSPARFVAHNGNGFDFPFLRARSLAHGLDPLAAMLWQDKPWDGLLVDTLDPSWCPRPPRGAGAMEGWSLDGLAELLGIERQPTTPGVEVPAAWYRQQFDAIEAHCLDDVRTLREVTRRLAAGRNP